MANDADEILFSEQPGKHGNLGLIVLNRPQALNALTQNMCITMNQQLKLWAHNPQIKAVVVCGDGDKAFCAGGDIRRIYDLGKTGAYDQAEQFFWHEYRNNATIFHYTKPYIALMDGVTMGGGVGISLHGSHRVATERTLFAMPETGIGFFPDVGGSYFLSRCDDEFGTYLALTGARLTGASMMDAGLADYMIMSHNLDLVLEKLATKDFSDNPFAAVDDVLSAFATTVEPSSELRMHRSMIESCFAFDDIDSIVRALAEHVSPWTNGVLTTLLTKSPTSLNVTLAQLRRGVTLNFEECLQMEYRLSQHFLRSHDFYEGIRAQLVDKDKTPRWDPAHITDVSSAMVSEYFAATDRPELVFV